MPTPLRPFTSPNDHHSEVRYIFPRRVAAPVTRDGDAEGVSRHGRRADRLTVVHRTPRGASLDRTGDPAPRLDPIGPRDCSTSRYAEVSTRLVVTSFDR